jgi:hypothetical protein
MSTARPKYRPVCARDSALTAARTVSAWASCRTPVNVMTGSSRSTRYRADPHSGTHARANRTSSSRNQLGSTTPRRLEGRIRELVAERHPPLRYAGVSLTFAAAIDDPARFKSSKQVGAYFGPDANQIHRARRNRTRGAVLYRDRTFGALPHRDQQDRYAGAGGWCQ